MLTCSYMEKSICKFFYTKKNYKILGNLKKYECHFLKTVKALCTSLMDSLS